MPTLFDLLEGSSKKDRYREKYKNVGNVEAGLRAAGAEAGYLGSGLAKLLGAEETGRKLADWSEDQEAAFDVASEKDPSKLGAAVRWGSRLLPDAAVMIPSAIATGGTGVAARVGGKLLTREAAKRAAKQFGEVAAKQVAEKVGAEALPKEAARLVSANAGKAGVDALARRVGADTLIGATRDSLSTLGRGGDAEEALLAGLRGGTLGAIIGNQAGRVGWAGRLKGAAIGGAAGGVLYRNPVMAAVGAGGGFLEGGRLAKFKPKKGGDAEVPPPGAKPEVEAEVPPEAPVQAAPEAPAPAQETPTPAQESTATAAGAKPAPRMRKKKAAQQPAQEPAAQEAPAQPEAQPDSPATPVAEAEPNAATAVPDATVPVQTQEAAAPAAVKPAPKRRKGKQAPVAKEQPVEAAAEKPTEPTEIIEESAPEAATATAEEPRVVDVDAQRRATESAEQVRSYPDGTEWTAMVFGKPLLLRRKGDVAVVVSSGAEIPMSTASLYPVSEAPQAAAAGAAKAAAKKPPTLKKKAAPPAETAPVEATAPQEAPVAAAPAPQETPSVTAPASVPIEQPNGPPAVAHTSGKKAPPRRKQAAPVKEEPAAAKASPVAPVAEVPPAAPVAPGEPVVPVAEASPVAQPQPVSGVAKKAPPRRRKGAVATVPAAAPVVNTAPETTAAMPVAKTTPDAQAAPPVVETAPQVAAAAPADATQPATGAKKAPPRPKGAAVTQAPAKAPPAGKVKFPEALGLTPENTSHVGYREIETPAGVQKVAIFAAEVDGKPIQVYLSSREVRVKGKRVSEPALRNVSDGSFVPLDKVRGRLTGGQYDVFDEVSEQIAGAYMPRKGEKLPLYDGESDTPFAHAIVEEVYEETSKSHRGSTTMVRYRIPKHGQYVVPLDDFRGLIRTLGPADVKPYQKPPLISQQGRLVKGGTFETADGSLEVTQLLSASGKPVRDTFILTDPLTKERVAMIKRGISPDGTRGYRLFFPHEGDVVAKLQGGGYGYQGGEYIPSKPDRFGSNATTRRRVVGGRVKGQQWELAPESFHPDAESALIYAISDSPYARNLTKMREGQSLVHFQPVRPGEGVGIRPVVTEGGGYSTAAPAVHPIQLASGERLTPVQQRVAKARWEREVNNPQRKAHIARRIEELYRRGELEQAEAELAAAERGFPQQEVFPGMTMNRSSFADVPEETVEYLRRAAESVTDPFRMEAKFYLDAIERARAGIEVPLTSEAPSGASMARKAQLENELAHNSNLMALMEQQFGPLVEGRTVEMNGPALRFRDMQDGPYFRDPVAAYLWRLGESANDPDLMARVQAAIQAGKKPKAAPRRGRAAAGARSPKA